MLNKMSKRYRVATALAVLCLLTSLGIASALDGPHNGLGYENVQCSSCHTFHNAAGSSLTKVAGNANLCMSCHVTGGAAGNWPFSTSDQANLVAKTGTSHRWDTDMGAMGLLLSTDVNAPNNPYGLRPVSEIVNPDVKRKLVEFNNGVVCSVCHFPHNYTNAPFDPYGSPGRTQYTGTANSGSQTTVVVSPSPGWAVNAWTGYYVKMTSGANSGKRRRVLSNTVDTLTLAAADQFPSAVAAGDTFYVSAIRHFMRMATTSDELCKDCHYYRTTAAQTNVRTWDGTKKSHPIGKNISSDVSDATQFNATPLEPSPAAWAQQSGARYEVNGGTDANLTNNITFGADSKISCLSCHNIHYSDTDTLTVDTPSGYAP